MIEARVPARHVVACLPSLGLNVPLELVDAASGLEVARACVEWRSAPSQLTHIATATVSPIASQASHSTILVSSPHPGLGDGVYSVTVRLSGPDGAPVAEIVLEVPVCSFEALPRERRRVFLAIQQSCFDRLPPIQPQPSEEGNGWREDERPSSGSRLALHPQAIETLASLGHGVRVFLEPGLPPLSVAVLRDAVLLNGAILASPLGHVRGFVKDPDRLPRVWRGAVRGAPMLRTDNAAATWVNVPREDRAQYYHFHQEHLPALLQLEKCRARHPDLFRQVVLPAYTPWQAEAVGLFGFNFESAISIDNEHLVARRLVVPSLALPAKLRVELTMVEVLQRIRASALTKCALTRKGPERVYVSRLGASRRPLENEEALVEALDARGFAIFDARGMTYLDQVLTLADARIVVGPHGAGLTNVGFARPGALVVEIFGIDYIKAHFIHLASLAGHRYRCFISRERGPSYPQDTTPWRVDVGEFLEFLDPLLADQEGEQASDKGGRR
jgi:capsular polysaccharide biosynthesis protein